MGNASKLIFRTLKILSLPTAILLLSACSTNPVTNRVEFDLVPESQEIAIGSEQYMGQRQQQQGDYVVDPALTDYVRDVGRRLVAVSDRQLPYEFVIVNSSDFNAWALPGGKIGINRGLLTRLECESELAAVLAHEIVHAAASHGTSNMSKKKMLEVITLASALAIDDQDTLEWVNGAVVIGGGLMIMKYGRDHELESDHYGMTYMARAGFDPAGMVTVQETMKKLSGGRDSNWLSAMVATHPPSAERVARSRKQLQEVGSRPDPEGCRRYQEATRHLKQTVVAYENYDKAVEAFAEGDLQQAAGLLDKAIAVEPRESLFYGLRARLSLKADRTDAAMADLDKAVSLNPDYWQHRLARGALRETRGDIAGAMADLKKSVALLPTVEAYYSLGKLSLANNQREQAIDYFWEAWDPQSELGIEAGKIVARLDLEENPGDYLDAFVYRGGDKNIVIEVQNNAEVPVQVLEVKLQKMKNFSFETFERYPVGETLATGDSISLATPVGPVKGKKMYKYRARVSVARVAE